MTEQAHEVIRTALALPPADRADVAAVLLASLESEPDGDADEHVFSDEWLAEIARRAQRAMSEPSTSDTPWEVVHAEITARLRSR